MKKTTTPAPRRAGTARKQAALARLRDGLSLLVDDRDSLELVARLVAKLAERSRVRRR